METEEVETWVDPYYDKQGGHSGGGFFRMTVRTTRPGGEGGDGTDTV